MSIAVLNPEKKDNERSENNNKSRVSVAGFTMMFLGRDRVNRIVFCSLSLNLFTAFRFLVCFSSLNFAALLRPALIGIKFIIIIIIIRRKIRIQ